MQSSVAQLIDEVRFARRELGFRTGFVRPNPYEVGRANLIVYNPSGQSSVLLDLTAVLAVGAKYQIVNVQDLFGAPVVSGTYSGGTVALPLVGVQPPVPVGLSSSPAPFPHSSWPSIRRRPNRRISSAFS